jgi:hypothetical protein
MFIRIKYKAFRNEILWHTFIVGQVMLLVIYYCSPTSVSSLNLISLRTHLTQLLLLLHE